MKRFAAILLLAAGGCAAHTSGCPSRLEPTYLPARFRQVAARALVPGGGARTWRDGDRLVQLVDHVTANLGDNVRSTKVRGFVAAYGATGLPAAPLAVEWRDRCDTPYALLARGIGPAELLRIANGLRP